MNLRERQLKGVTIGMVLLFTGILLIQCDAPHDNPLDPDSEYYVDPPEKDNPTEFLDFDVRTRYILEPTLGGTIIVEAQLHDDDDIREVELVIDDTARYRMNYTGSDSTWKHSLFYQQNGIFRYQGASFYVYVYDQRGYVRRSERGSISRVIDDFPQLVYPSDGSLVDLSINPDLNLIWRKYTPNFSQFSLFVRVITAQDCTVFAPDGVSPSVLPQVPSDTLDTLFVDAELLDETYFWSIRVQDRFGNEAISNLFEFEVVNTANDEARDPRGNDQFPVIQNADNRVRRTRR